jgi:hypothetical protein
MSQSRNPLATAIASVIVIVRHTSLVNAVIVARRFTEEARLSTLRCSLLDSSLFGESAVSNTRAAPSTVGLLNGLSIDPSAGSLSRRRAVTFESSVGLRWIRVVVEA